MKQKLNLSTAKLLMPTQPDPTKWRKAGDPRPIVQLADGTRMEIVPEERTPFTVSMNSAAITNDGLGLPTSYHFSATPLPGRSGPLTMTIEPTSLQPPRYYRTEKDANGNPRVLQKEKAQWSLPEEWSLDLSNPPNTRYKLNYWMRFAADFQSPPTDYHYCLVMQGWQGPVKHPPLQLGVITYFPTDLVRLRLMAEDDATEVTPRESKIVSDFVLRKGEWHKFSFNLVPNYNGQGGDGEIGVTIDDTEPFVWVGDWGYKPGPDRTSKIGLGAGIYRMTQPKRQTVSFKSFKFEVMT